MRLWSTFILSAALAASLACGDRPINPAIDEEQAKEVDQAELRQVTEQRATEREDRTGKALVQIQFTGAMVFDRSQAGKIRVYLPTIAGHKIKLDQGITPTPNNPRWHNIVKDPLAGTTWTLQAGLATSPLQSIQTAADLTVKPQSAEHARDSGWLFQASNIAEAGRVLDPSSAALTVELEAGDFETCVLVADKDGFPCEVTVGIATKKVALAESMVLRREIEGTARVFMGPHEITANPGASVNGYNKVFDIAIVNVPPSSQRELTTNHSATLTKMFVGAAKANWKPTTAVGCSNAVKQPTCHDYFLPFSNRYSGANRPICPLVEGP